MTVGTSDVAMADLHLEGIQAELVDGARDGVFLFLDVVKLQNHRVVLSAVNTRVAQQVLVQPLSVALPAEAPGPVFLSPEP